MVTCLRIRMVSSTTSLRRREQFGMHTFQNVCPHQQFRASQSGGGVVTIKKWWPVKSRGCLYCHEMLLLHLMENCICRVQHHKRSGGGPGVQSCRTSSRSGEPRPSLSHSPRLPYLPKHCYKQTTWCSFCF